MIHRSSAALAVALLVSGCMVPPPPQGPRGSAYPRSRPMSDDALSQESSLLRDRARARFEEQKRRVERVGQRLLDTLPDHPKVQFVIAQGDPSINAGASFGQIAITSGMLNFVKSDDEMAVVLGHELAHIEQGHVMKGAVSGLALGILATVLDARVPGAGQAAGGVGQLFLNHFTQNQEREADEVGLRFAYQAGYDPSVAAGLQERLAVEVPQTMSAGYFDSHPSSVERAVLARREAEELLAQGDPPGRKEALALERADERAVDTVRRGRGREPSYDARAEPQDQAPAGGQSDSEACRRAAVYAEMARDSQDPAERKELHDRALRYCPTLAEAREAPRSSGHRRDDDSGPGDDTY